MGDARGIMIISGVALLTFWPQPKDLKVSLVYLYHQTCWLPSDRVLRMYWWSWVQSSSARWASTDSACNSTSTGGWCYSTCDSFMPAYAVALIEHQSPNEALWFAGNLFTLPFWHVASLDWSDADTVTYKSLLLMLLDNAFMRLLNICKRKAIGWNLKLYFVSIWDFGIAATASSCVRAILSMSERQAVLRCLVDYTCI
jgi:hypothetical protein